MPFVLDDAYVVVDAVNMSEFVTDVSVPQEVAELDATTMGNDTTINEPGLKSWSVSFTVLNAYNAGSTGVAAGADVKLSALYSARSKFPLEIRPKDAAVGAGNPKWTGSGFISSYEPITGSVGELVSSSVTISATTALTRSVT